MFMVLYVLVIVKFSGGIDANNNKNFEGPELSLFSHKLQAYITYTTITNKKYYIYNVFK